MIFSYNENEQNNCFHDNVTNEQILQIMHKIKSNCSGNDNIQSKEIKKIKYQISDILKKQINEDLKYGRYPENLKKIVITPIFKSGERSNPNNYRPLCITNYFAKI